MSFAQYCLISLAAGSLHHSPNNKALFDALSTFASWACLYVSSTIFLQRANKFVVFELSKVGLCGFFDLK
ncbi:Uncharacterised protein [Mesomycoplasma hyorhinis]|nr:Uncharacterised protein [Mesomycoplasma hyorhinis]